MTIKKMWSGFIGATWKRGVPPSLRKQKQTRNPNMKRVFLSLKVLDCIVSLKG